MRTEETCKNCFEIFNFPNRLPFQRALQHLQQLAVVDVVDEHAAARARKQLAVIIGRNQRIDARPKQINYALIIHSIYGRKGT